MQTFKTLLCLTLLSSLTACNSGSKGSPQLQPSNPSTAQRGRTEASIDISAMPLEQAIRTKYSRLQVLCDRHIKTTILDTEGRRISDSQDSKYILWDLLEDFSDKKHITNEALFPHLKFDFVMDLALSLETTQYTSDKLPNEVIHYHNAATLSGRKTYSVTQNFNEFGHTQEGYSQTPDGTILNENTPIILIHSISSDPNEQGYEISFNCTLSGDIKPDFKSDTSIEKINP